MTISIHTIKELQTTLRSHRIDKKIAFVPTMGNLHQGHISLVKQAKDLADIVIVSIFVNPTQFGEGEDFDSYPRTLDADLDKLRAVGTDYVFAPNVSEMYPNYPNMLDTHISLGKLATHLCGQSRPTHFDGVGLIVSKLFNIVQADIAIFGKKDYQQLALIRQLVDELNFPIEIIGGDIVRADDGLALSSRNQYLTDEQRAIAPNLNRIINQLATDIKQQAVIDKSALDTAKLEELKQQAITNINALGFKVDYLDVLNRQLNVLTTTDTQLVILVAAWLGQARLLDNVEVSVQR